MKPFDSLRKTHNYGVAYHVYGVPRRCCPAIRGSVRAQGFTLVEAMIVVIIIAILAAFAIPAFKDMMRRGQITAATQEVLADLTLAKGEAVRRSVNTYLVSSNSDGVTTWQIRAGDPTTGELLQQRQARDSVTITPASASTSNPGNIVFQPRGSAEGGAATIRLSHNDAPDTNRACVTVSWAGNITVSPIDKINADCFTP